MQPEQMGREGSGTGPKIALAYVRRGSVADARYLALVERAGGVPVPLWDDEPAWEDLLPGAAGLLLTGGGDIDPRLFGKDDCQLCGEVDPGRDAREAAAFAFAETAQLPVLGICRGMQFVNVIYRAGGRAGLLLEDLSDGVVRHRPLDDKTSSFHEVTVLPRTRLARALGAAGRQVVNSRHHQGLHAEHLAGGLVISALAPDGIVEGLEAPGDWFLVGVQCHPERADEVPHLAGVARALVEAAARR